MKFKHYVALLLFPTASAFGQYTNVVSVHDGAGRVSSGGSYTNISACAQPGGVTVSSDGAGSLVNQAGFLNTFTLQPNQLSARGIPVEIDPDNDADGLADATEITGSAFDPATPTDPNNPWSSGGGMSDLEAAVAGVDPLDPGGVFRISAITNAAGQVIVKWRAHGNNERTYVVYAATNAAQPYAQVVFSNTVAGGSYPWYLVTNAVPLAVSNVQFVTATVAR